MNNNIKKAKQYIDCFNKEKPNITMPGVKFSIL